jgi:hypothetical protein
MDELNGMKLSIATSVRTANIIALIIRLPIRHPFWTFPVSTTSAHRPDVVEHTWNLPKWMKIGMYVDNKAETLYETYQSLGLLPEKTTLVTTWFGSGLGMGTSRMVILGPLPTLHRVW